MPVTLGHLSYDICFKESRGDKHSLSAHVPEMDTCFSDEPQYLQAEWLAARPAEPTAGHSTSIHISVIPHFDPSPLSPHPDHFLHQSLFFPDVVTLH